MQITGTIALVTGAASGLGAATARDLARAGARVALLDRDGDAARRAATGIDGLGLTADVTDATAIEAALDRACDHFGAVPRIVVNCAGIGTAGRILPRDGQLGLEAFARTIDVNLMGTYRVMAICARAMAQADPLDADGARGVIVNTASVAWQDGQVGQAAYAASKGGIASLTLPAARELARFGIRVMTIAPGLFETAMSAGLTPQMRRDLEQGIPFPPRMGRPEEYAMLVRQIVENPALNGEIIRLDGAVRLAAR